MAVLSTSGFNFPDSISTGIFKKAQGTSILSRLAASEPQKFGKQVKWILTAAPKAELVGEGAEKSPTPTAYEQKVISPLKTQVTMRFTDEVMWADEDTQIGILEDMQENAGIALGRALDLAAIHKLNPLTGTVSSLISEGITDTTQSVTATADYDQNIEAAAGMLIDAGYTPTGIALDTALSFDLSTMRDKEGRKLYPELGFGQSMGNFEGMTAGVSDTVSAKAEAKTATNLLGIVGQFNAFRWGVQRQIGAHVIEYGDPDGLGDLQRMNQIAIRVEIVYGIGIMDLNAFVKIMKASA